MQRLLWKWSHLAAAVLLLAEAHGARADIVGVVALDPPDGVILATPGDTVGWGFTFTSGTYWTSIDSVSIENETSPLGTGVYFVSYMDLLGGETNSVTAPGRTWSLTFSPGSPGTGIGQYTIDPGTPPGASDSGDFVIYYDEFSADPNICGTCYVDTQQLFDSSGSPPAFTINVAAAETTPEPATGAAAVVGGVLAAILRRRFRNSRPTSLSEPAPMIGTPRDGCLPVSR